jgi:thiosulfate reductase cytochrome b subunit
MSPGMDAAWPWLIELFGGRQSARSIHFIAASGIVLFVIVHLTLVVLAGPIGEVWSMITGRWTLPAALPPEPAATSRAEPEAAE